MQRFAALRRKLRRGELPAARIGTLGWRVVMEAGSSVPPFADRRGVAVNAAPVAPRRAQSFTERGETRDDSLAWLRDKADPAVDAYLRAENAYTAAVMAPTVPLQEALYAEMIGRIKQDDASVPYRRGN